MLHWPALVARDRVSAARRTYVTLALAGVTLLALHYTTGLGGGSNRLFDVWLYNGLVLLAVLACALRVLLVRSERAPWIALAVALGLWELGEIFYDFFYAGNPPFPSVADAFYLSFYPACYVALLLLLRSRVSAVNRSLWLDGIMASLAAAAVGAALLVQVVLDSTHGSFWVVVTNTAYPIGDVLLVAVVIGVLAVTGWRAGRTWIVLGAALLLTAFADGVYLFQMATNTYVENRLWDILWPAALLLLAMAPWVATGRRPRVQLEGRPLIVTPAICGLIGIAILLTDHFSRLNVAANILATATLVAVLVRTGLTFRENGRILDRIRSHSVTDSLTGLGNRRALMADLELALDESNRSTPRLLIIFDLDGFKRYNDTFGHPAGDALLARLGVRLATAMQGLGEGYRLGGDEFCVLADVERNRGELIIELASMALSEEGDGFAVHSSFGAAFMPDEATEPAQVLHIADGRLYAQKSSLTLGRGRPHEVLLQALFEREPELHEHVRDVADLSVEIGRRVGLTPAELDELKLAAELHDIGKLAIPDTILHKPGVLTEVEWAFVRQHTIIGQRILAAAPAMHKVGLIVRASHECWDGTGYADGLAGEEIPLGARIIAASDAYTAMITLRPYSPARSTEDAVAEIRRCAGTQFDPGIVAVLCAVLAQRAASATAANAA